MADLPPVIATDQDARAAGEFRYLGPKGRRFSAIGDHRDTSYFVAAACVILLAPLGALLAPAFLVDGLVFDTLLRLLFALLSVIPAYFLARWIMRHVDQTRTPRWHARTLYLEIHAPRPDRRVRTGMSVPRDLHV